MTLTMTEEKLEKLRAVAQNKKVLILTHNNPDPDAISAGWALSYLLTKRFKAACELAYGGLITRAENRAMVRILNIPIKPLQSVQISDFDVFALVDTQPRAGNNSLPSRIRQWVRARGTGTMLATSAMSSATGLPSNIPRTARGCLPLAGSGSKTREWFL